MKAQGIGICEWALPTPLRGPLVCRVLKDLGLAAVELKLGTVEENFPLANRYTLDLYKEEQAKYGTVFTGIAVNLTDFYAMTAPLGSSDREMVEYALRTAVDAAQYLGAPLIHVPSLHALKSEVRTSEGLKNTAEMQLRQLELVDRENYGIYFDTQTPPRPQRAGRSVADRADLQPHSGVPYQGRLRPDQHSPHRRGQLRSVPLPCRV